MGNDKEFSNIKRIEWESISFRIKNPEAHQDGMANPDQRKG